MMSVSEPMSEFKARQLGALELAYIGDSVYECCVRERLLLAGGGRMKALHRAAVSRVRASYQADALRRISPILTPDEQGVCRRARNAQSGSMPKHAEPADYHAATAFEALIGYLYISGQDDRLGLIVEAALSPENNTDAVEGEGVNACKTQCCAD